MNIRLRIGLLAYAVLSLVLSGCENEPPRKTDAELGLTPVQARGRQLYDQQCGSCHKAYSSGGRQGPSLKGIFKKPYMPSGTPARDERVREVITYGRSKMPPFGGALTPEQVEEIIQYLHTL